MPKQNGQPAAARNDTAQAARSEPASKDLTTEQAASLVLRSLDAAIGSERVDRYFRGDTALKLDGTVLLVLVPSPFHGGLIERRFGSALRDAVAEHLGPGCRYEVRVDEDRARQDRDREDLPGEARVDGDRQSGRDNPLDDRLGDGAGHRAGGPTPTPPARRAVRAAKRTPQAIDERFDLSRFLVGPSNRMAFDAATRVAERGNDAGNERGDGGFTRLFLHGPCGVGKSHLLRGIARRADRAHADPSDQSRPGGLRVKCVSAETFTNEYIQAVQSGNVDGFRRRHRRLDLLCIDDVHFVAGKNATQVELLHTLDAIELDGARLVLASDEHPHAIRQLSKGLASRFVSGMVVGIDPPDADLRRRLIREFASRRGLTLDDSAVECLGRSGRQPLSARDIEGTMTRLDAAATLSRQRGRVLAASDVEDLLRGESGDAIGQGPSLVRFGTIRDAVCEPLAVDSAELGRSGRHPRVVMARALITLLCRELTTMSYPEIARALGKKNHSTVITAHQRIDRQMGEPVRLGLAVDGLTIEQLRDRLRGDLAGGRQD
ncbi:MAG: DnaA/Hda family protein [Planctomycetota bacterium]